MDWRDRIVNARTHTHILNHEWIALLKGLMLNVSYVSCGNWMYARISNCNCITSSKNFKRTYFKRLYFYEHLMRAVCHCKSNWNSNSTHWFPRQLWWNWISRRSSINLLLVWRVPSCVFRCVKMVLSTIRRWSTILPDTKNVTCLYVFIL